MQLKNGIRPSMIELRRMELRATDHSPILHGKIFWS